MSKVMFRGKIPEDLNRQVRALSLLTEKNLSDIATEALQDWVNKAENQALLEKHNMK